MKVKLYHIVEFLFQSGGLVTGKYVNVPELRLSVIKCYC